MKKLDELSPKDVLVRAREMITQGWIKGAAARKRADGVICRCASAAVRDATWELLGGESAVLALPDAEFTQIFNWRQRVNERVVKTQGIDHTLYGLVWLNDQPKTTQEMMIAAFTAAIAAAEAEAQGNA